MTGSARVAPQRQRQQRQQTAVAMMVLMTVLEATTRWWTVREKPHRLSLHLNNHHLRPFLDGRLALPRNANSRQRLATQRGHCSSLFIALAAFWAALLVQRPPWVATTCVRYSARGASPAPWQMLRSRSSPRRFVYTRLRPSWAQSPSQLRDSRRGARLGTSTCLSTTK